jgi:hypothetical protein
VSEEEVAATAQRLIELYGLDAEIVADGKAETYAECEQILEMLDWSRIADKICELQRRRNSLGITS